VVEIIKVIITCQPPAPTARLTPDNQFDYRWRMTYLLRDVDDKTWSRFKRACGDRSMRDVIVDLIAAFVRGEIAIGARQVMTPADVRRGRFPRRTE
jgi:hypothetical protein